MEFQVTFDANDPAKLADFWQAALDYKRDDPPNGFDTWDAFLKEAGVPEEKWNDADAIVPLDGSGPRIYFQKVPEGKVVKNRVHLDLWAAHGLKDIERMIARSRRGPSSLKASVRAESAGSTLTDSTWASLSWRTRRATSSASTNESSSASINKTGSASTNERCAQSREGELIDQEPTHPA